MRFLTDSSSSCCNRKCFKCWSRALMVASSPGNCSWLLSQDKLNWEASFLVLTQIFISGTWSKLDPPRNWFSCSGLDQGFDLNTPVFICQGISSLSSKNKCSFLKLKMHYFHLVQQRYGSIRAAGGGGVVIMQLNWFKNTLWQRSYMATALQLVFVGCGFTSRGESVFSASDRMAAPLYGISLVIPFG